LEHLEGDGGDLARRVDLLTRLGEAEYVAGSVDARTHLREAALLAQGQALDLAMANALLVHTRTSFDEEQESDLEKIELLEYVMERLVDVPAVRARVMGALAVELIFVGEVERRAELLDQARELAVQADDDFAFVDVVAARFNAAPRPTWSTAAFRRDFDDVSTALAAAERLGATQWIAVTRLAAAFSTLVLSDGAGFRGHVERLRELAEATQNGVARRMLLLVEQMLMVNDGRLVEAQALSVELFEVWSAAGIPEATTYQGTTGMATRREQGRLAQIIDAWSAFLADHPGAASVDATVAFALAETGDVDRAAARLEAACRNGFRDMPADAGWPLGIGMWSEVAAIVADRAGAATLHALAESWDGVQMATGGINTGPVARHLARLELVLDRSADADRHFAEAIEQSRALGSPVWIARTCLDWAESLLRRGETARARQLVADARNVMEPLALPRLEQQLASLAEQLPG
jgi:hypothetical protein